MCSCHSILECCVTFSGVKLSIRSFVLFSPTSVYLGPVYKSGKNKVTKYASMKISYTGNYLFL